MLLGNFRQGKAVVPNGERNPDQAFRREYFLPAVMDCERNAASAE
jgi:hypothetical protein